MRPRQLFDAVYFFQHPYLYCQCPKSVATTRKVRGIWKKLDKFRENSQDSRKTASPFDKLTLEMYNIGKVLFYVYQ